MPVRPRPSPLGAGGPYPRESGRNRARGAPLAAGARGSGTCRDRRRRLPGDGTTGPTRGRHALRRASAGHQSRSARQPGWWPRTPRFSARRLRDPQSAAGERRPATDPPEHGSGQWRKPPSDRASPLRPRKPVSGTRSWCITEGGAACFWRQSWRVRLASTIASQATAHKSKKLTVTLSLSCRSSPAYLSSPTSILVSECRSERIDLCCHHEVVSVETADLVCPESHRHLTPFGENRGMMAFSLGEHTNAIRKG